MAEIKLHKVEQGQTKIRNVPIAVTPEGFWCCPYPVVFQKTLKSQNHLNKCKPSSPPPPPCKTSVQKKQPSVSEKKLTPNPSTSRAVPDDQQASGCLTPPDCASVVPERVTRPKTETSPRKVAIEFGERGTRNLKVVLLGKQGVCVKLSVHKNVLVQHSCYFANKLSDQQFGSSHLEIDDCEDVEIYVETVGLMYSKDMKQRLTKQSVSRVLRILKVAELLGFNSCMQSCLDYLEAVPWVGEEEEKVVTSVLRLQDEGIGGNSVLKRVFSDNSNSPNDTLTRIIELVLSSNEERGRREMKSVVLKLLRENNNIQSNAGSPDSCNESIYSLFRNCLDSLLSLFKQGSDQDFAYNSLNSNDTVGKQIALEADNLTWLFDILADRQAADEYALIWANQQELATLHTKLPIVSRYHVSFITSRLFVGIGKGELLPSKDTRQLLLQTWLQPLINDYSWLQHGCRSFDRKVVEEGIGRTILTLPLEDEQSILLAWMSSFLKTGGDNCPNLLTAFEVWWRRTFIRPFAETQGSLLRPDSSMASILPT